jgi:hypothetical protein
MPTPTSAVIMTIFVLQGPYETNIVMITDAKVTGSGSDDALGLHRHARDAASAREVL